MRRFATFCQLASALPYAERVDNDETGAWSDAEPVSDTWAVRTRPTGDRVLEFECFEIGHDPRLYFADSPDGSPTYNINEAVPGVTGWLRWDGCCHLQVGTDAAPWHYDSAPELAALTAALMSVRQLAKTRIPGYEGEA